MSSRPLDHDLDPIETQEWLDALDSVIHHEGENRAHYLLTRLAQRARESGTDLPYAITTPYRNTIPKEKEAKMPGDLFMERKIRSFIRWNALAMVMRAGKKDLELGGHISSFSSAATLYEIGFNYFFRGSDGDQEGDLVYFQGHSSPGIYARAFLEGRITEDQLDNFRQEVGGKGLSSYPHPKLMPEFWQFPTVSMGLGPLQAIYQARFLKYLQSRELEKGNDRRVWAFLGDGECDEPESLGAISMAGREKLDNLIFVINCNLQRLDGPVRGNGKIVQELEGVFRGAGWNVIKVIWGRHWDPLFDKDRKGVMQQRMDEACDGDYQNYKFKGGSYTRDHFFGTSPELADIVSHLSDEEINRLNRGGHDPYKVYAAYHKACYEANGRPTVILAKTVKGYGFGPEAEAANITHSVKKLSLDALKGFRDRFDIPIEDGDLESLPYYKPEENSAAMRYLHEQRRKLNGYLPKRRKDSDTLQAPPLDKFSGQTAGTGERQVSTTMAFVRILSTLSKDKTIGAHIVPIVPDEARTFGMEGMFRSLGIFSQEGQKYTPMDADQVMYYKEDSAGQILEEGINEDGAQASWLAAACSYSNNSVPMIPFYSFYSMFGFQRVMDLIWAGGDMQARGFLMGGTAGRTTLNGEGLQHEDGHSHILASTIPNCVSYDPTYAHELAVIVQNGIKRMYEDNENIFYYITIMNENYPHPKMPDGCEDGILKGMYPLKKSGKRKAIATVELLGSGTILREVEAAADILERQYNVGANIWSCTSFNELRKDGLEAERWNRLNPTKKAKVPYVSKCLSNAKGPVIAATDYMKAFSDQIREWVPTAYTSLGTDGFGRSDSRDNLRSFFEVNRAHVVFATLSALYKDGVVDAKTIEQAQADLGIDPSSPNPVSQ